MIIPGLLSDLLSGSFILHAANDCLYMLEVAIEVLGWKEYKHIFIAFYCSTLDKAADWIM